MEAELTSDPRHIIASSIMADAITAYQEAKNQATISEQELLLDESDNEAGRGTDTATTTNT